MYRRKVNCTLLKTTEIFGDLITEEEVCSFDSVDGLTHPLKYLLSDENERYESHNFCKMTQFNTKNAFAIVYEKDLSFLKRKKKSLISKDQANSSAALGEIRCFGILLDIFGNGCVTAVKEDRGKKTPDFKVEICDLTIYIETATLQINGKERESLAEFNRTRYNHNKSGVNFSEHIVCPYGHKQSSEKTPNGHKQFFGTTPSVIYKLCSTKRGEKQLLTDCPSVIWIDCQDEYMNGIADRLNKNGPIFSGKSSNSNISGFSSNEVWYSLYAKKGMPIFDGETLDNLEGFKKELSKMEFDGRFIGNKLSAVIFNGPNALTIYENPSADSSLPSVFVEKLSCWRTFKYETSRTNFPDNNLKVRVDIDYALIERFGAKDFYAW